MTSHRPAAVVIMAAGLGTRMKSAIPKVLHEIGGRSLVGHAVVTARALSPEHLVVVIGNGRELVEAHLKDVDPGARTAVQEQQRGTGDAVRAGLTVVPADFDGSVIVTSGDVPLLEAETLHELIAEHDKHGNAITVLTARVPDPTGYGRIIAGPDGTVAGIVEHKDATPEQREIDEINAGIYVFDAATLRDGLSRLTTDNAQGELYLTDVLAIARNDGKRVGAHVTDDAMQTEGVNDRVQLATLRAELNRRTLDKLMRDGVTIVDPNTTWVDRTVQLARDVTLLPNTQLHGATTVDEGATIGPDTTLTDVEVGAGATIIRTHGSSSGDRPRSLRRPVRLPAPRYVGRREGQDRHLRRDQEHDHRRRREGPAPDVRRGRDDRRGREHRRRHDLRQLRRGREAPDAHRQALVHRQQLGAGRAADGRRRRLSGRRDRADRGRRTG